MRRLFFALLFSFEASSGLFCGREGRWSGEVACELDDIACELDDVACGFGDIVCEVNKYKCVFSVGIYSNSCLLVANHTIFLLFLYALKAEGGALATEC